jgi:tetratricopeptide (TPR) repeat protein
MKSVLYKSTILVLFISISGISFAQNQKIDSLYQLLNKSDIKKQIEILHNIHKLTYSNNPKSSIRTVNQAIQLANSSDNNKELITLYQDKAMSYVYLNEYDTALNYAQKAKELAIKLEDKFGKASSTEMLGNVFWYKSNFQKVTQCYFDALKIFEELGNETRIFNIYSNLGTLKYSLGEYEKATNYYLKAYEMIDTTLYPNDAGACLNNLGLIYQEWGNRAKALEYFIKALNFQRKADVKRAISANLTNIGSIFLEEDNFDKALDYYRQGLLLDQSIDNQYGMGSSYLSLCTVYEKIEKPDSIFHYALKAKEIFEKIENNQGLAKAHLHIGNGYFTQKKYNSSIKEYSKSAEISRALNDEATLCKALSELGISYYKYGNYRKAINALNESLDLAVKNNYVYIAHDNYKHLSESWAQLKNPIEENRFLKEYIHLSDSIFAIEKQKLASELLVKYEVEKTEAELEIQTQQKVINKNKYLRQRLISITIALTLLLSVLVGFLLYKRYLQKKKTNKLLEKHSKEIELKQKEIEKQNIILEKQANTLQEVDEIKSRFYSNISHEFRTPLTLIMGPIQNVIKETKMTTLNTNCVLA